MTNVSVFLFWSRIITEILTTYCGTIGFLHERGVEKLEVCKLFIPGYLVLHITIIDPAEAWYRDNAMTYDSGQ